MSLVDHQTHEESNLVSLKNRGTQEQVKPRVLVVDDEEDLLELVRYNLTKEGYVVECVGSGEEALKAARRQPPDLIVLDLMLPAVDGLEVCRRLKADPKTREVPIVMLTANALADHIAAAEAAGADRHLAKPFDAAELLELISTLPRPGAVSEAA